MILKYDLAQIMNAACWQSLVSKRQKTMPMCVHPSLHTDCGFQQLFKHFDLFIYFYKGKKKAASRMCSWKIWSNARLV